MKLFLLAFLLAVVPASSLRAQSTEDDPPTAAGGTRGNSDAQHVNVAKKVASSDDKAAPAKAEEKVGARAGDAKTLEKPSEEPQAAPAKTDEKAAPAKIEEKPAAKAEEKKPEPAKPEEKPLNAGARKFQPVADSYQKAHDEFLIWLRGASETLETSEKKTDDLKKQIEDLSAQATKLDLEQKPEASQKAKDVRAQKDEAWKQLKEEQARHDKLVKALGAAVNDKIKGYNQAVWEAAKAATQPAK